MSDPPIHASLSDLAFLVGTWEGEGRGLWAADPPFRYRERVVVDHDGRPFLRYEQRTWSLADGVPRHAELGWLRRAADGTLEMIVSQMTGIADVHSGRLEGRTLTLEAEAIALAPTAKRVTAITRRITVEDRTLHYLVRIAMNHEPVADHLEATLRRTRAQTL